MRETHRHFGLEGLAQNDREGKKGFQKTRKDVPRVSKIRETGLAIDRLPATCKVRWEKLPWELTPRIS